MGPRVMASAVGWLAVPFNGMRKAGRGHGLGEWTAHLQSWPSCPDVLLGGAREQEEVTSRQWTGHCRALCAAGTEDPGWPLTQVERPDASPTCPHPQVPVREMASYLVMLPDPCGEACGTGS